MERQRRDWKKCAIKRSHPKEEEVTIEKIKAVKLFSMRGPINGGLHGSACYLGRPLGDAISIDDSVKARLGEKAVAISVEL